jgi:CRISPR-associated protein Cmr3
MASCGGILSTKGAGVMRIFIEPNEPLLFRRGRSFDAGEGNFAESMFPPTPETLQGAIRALIASYWDKNSSLAAVFKDPKLTALIGDSEDYGRFRITGLALGRWTKEGTFERLFPTPAHLIQDDKNRLRLKPEVMDIDHIKCNLPEGIGYLLKPRESTEGKLKPLGGWLTEANLQLALTPKTADSLSQLEVVKPAEIFEYEPRLGIGMSNATKTTMDGYLYQVQMVRMKPLYGFVIDIRLSESSSSSNVVAPTNEVLLDDSTTQSMLRLPSTGWLTIGGEQRTAHFTVLRLKDMVSGVDIDQSKKGRLVYIAAPAYFSDGWKPSENHFPKLSKPLAAATNRYEPIGGWKLDPNNAGGTGKTTRRCVPAGSVYFFEESVPIEQPLTEYGWQIGYGIAYTGEY